MLNKDRRKKLVEVVEMLRDVQELMNEVEEGRKKRMKIYRIVFRELETARKWKKISVS